LPDDECCEQKIAYKQNQCRRIAPQRWEDVIGPIEHRVTEHGSKHTAIRVGIEPGKDDPHKDGGEQETPDRAIVVELLPRNKEQWEVPQSPQRTGQDGGIDSRHLAPQIFKDVPPPSEFLL
jgi:hypothetical protein